MPYISENIKIAKTKFDRRIKLTDEQKQEIRLRWWNSKHKTTLSILDKGLSQRKLAKEYNVSRRLIVWILYPERLIENRKRREEHGGWKQYYNTDKWWETMREHRSYKQGLYLKGLIQAQISYKKVPS